MALTFLFYLLCAITDCPPQLIHSSRTNPPRISLEGSLPPTSNRFIRSHPRHETVSVPIVSTRLGDIQGRFMESRGERKIAAFEGIKYGKAPTGSRRFKLPVPVSPWKGQLLVANRTAKDCLQLDFTRLLQVRGVEDCLYLNVYSNHKTLLESTGSRNVSLKNPFPVIVFIHGGGWMSHSGSNYGPRYLLEREVVLVTFNFRLGILGFLSTGDTAAPGNYALHDQALAFKWVNEHISSFGGDPKRITLMGESTGAGSVALHLLSPITTKVLPSIHGAILLSGSSMNHWAIMNDTVSNTKALARRMHCPTDNSHSLVTCLRAQDPYFVVGQQLQLWAVPVISRLLFGPVIESPVNNPSAFILESPLVTYTTRPQNVKPVPIIAGLNRNEGAIFAANVYMVPFLYNAINNQWDKMAAYIMAYDRLPQVNVHETSKKIAKFYFNNKRWSFNNRDQISNALGDRTIATGVYKFLQHHSQVASSYGYYFTYSSNAETSMLSQQGLRSKDWGVSHGDELPFIFSMDRVFDGDFGNAQDIAVSRWLIDICVNFAYDRQPFPGNQVSENVTWSPVLNPKYMEVLKVNVNKRMIPFPSIERMKFWESLHLN